VAPDTCHFFGAVSRWSPCGLFSAGKILSPVLNKHHKLKKAVSVIKHNIRGTDPLFRIGGEEFVVLLDSPIAK